MTSSEPENVQDSLSFLLDAALKAGATDADCLHLSGDGESLSLRNGQTDSLERDESLDYGLRVFVGGRVAGVSTNRADRETLQTLAERAVAMAKTAPVDPYAGLHDQSVLARGFEQHIGELDLFDPGEPATENLIERARAAESEALKNKGVRMVDTVAAGWGKSRIALATSRGFFGQYSGSSHSLSAVVLAGEGEKTERDYDYTAARFLGDLETPEKIGRTAAERAVSRLNPVKKQTCKVPVIFDRRVAGSLLSAIAGGINGSAVARGSSFLKDRLNEQILPDSVSIRDDPRRIRGFGSKIFDAEGMLTRPKTVVDQGMLKTWILDLASAAQLGLSATGNAARGLTGSPGPSVTNFYMEPGTTAREELIAGLEEGFLICDMMGHGVNMTTGDYSRGAGGFWIRNGRIAEAVNEMTVAGKMQDMLMTVIPGDDLEFNSPVSCPSLLIDGMTVGGL